MPIREYDELAESIEEVLVLLKWELPDLRLIGDSEERALAFEKATDRLQKAYEEAYL